MDDASAAVRNKPPSVDRLLGLAKEDMAGVDALIRERMQSPVSVIPALAEHIIADIDLRRFGDFHAGTRALHERAVHAYGAYYDLHYPGEELSVARDARRSPLWQILKERGAVYGSKFGWERPNWFSPPGMNFDDEPSFEAKPNWFRA